MFQYIVEKSADAILTTDQDFQIVYANGACKQLLAQTLTGKPLASIWFDDDMPLLEYVIDWARIGGFYSMHRLNGFRSITDLYPDIAVVASLAADWSRCKAYQVAEEILEINPPGTLDVIWAASSEMALGAMQVVEAHGRQDDVKIFSNDVTPETAERIREGRLLADTHHGFAEWGWYGTKFGVMLALGQDVPPTFDTLPQTMYRDNVDQFHPNPALEPIDWEHIKAGQSLPDEIVIGWLQIVDTGPYVTATHFFEKAAAEAREHGMNVRINTRMPAKPDDFIDQAALIDEFIRQRVDVIALATVSVDVIKDAISRANEVGIPVIVLNQLEPIAGVDIACYIGFDNMVAGMISAYAVVDYLGGPGVLGRGERVPVSPDIPLSLDWWQTHYDEIDPQTINVAGRVAIIEGISGRWHGETRLVRSNGEVIYVDATTAPIYSSTGQFDGMAVFFKDATERKRAEEQLHSSLEMERQMNELRKRLVVNLSHEIRTPLTIISSSANLLRFYGQRMSEDRRFTKLDQIMEQVQVMTKMLEDTLMVQKAETGYLEFAPQLVDVRGICQTAIENMHLSMPERTVNLDIQGNCALAILDPQLLLTILVNLLSNAVKYSPAEKRIGLTIKCEADTLILSVQDYGIGIPNDEREHIFESFYRAANVRSVGGVGLGLSIVQNAVELHGGMISVESEVGVGSTFTVRLPFYTAEE